jgi:hypothetical protein
MQNLHDHLLAAEERVANELAGSQRNGLFSVCHLCERRIDKSAYDNYRDRYRRGGCRWGSLSIGDLRKVVRVLVDIECAKLG